MTAVIARRRASEPRDTALALWHAREAVGYFERISELAARTCPRFEAVYAAWVQRALAGERFAFPADLTAPALMDQSQPLSKEERAEVQRWVLRLSQIDDLEIR